MNYDIIFHNENPVLLVTLLVLIAMSLTSWYVLFWKALTLKKERQFVAQFCKSHVKTPDWPIRSEIQHSGGAVEILLQEANKLKPVMAPYSHQEKKEILSMHLVQNLDLIKIHLDRGLTILASIGSSAPFVGLFGTVVGIVGALAKISTMGNAGIDVVAGPMSEALIATAVGLFAAIPAVLAYNSFVRLNRLLVQDLRHIAEQLTIYLSLSKESK